jgi:hypothetical protein
VRTGWEYESEDAPYPEGPEDGYAAVDSEEPYLSAEEAGQLAGEADPAWAERR